MAHLKLKVIVHQVEEGGYCAEVPAIPGCATQGDTFEEFLGNLNDAEQACVSMDICKCRSSASEPPRETAA